MLDLDSSMNEEGPLLCQEYARVWDSKDNIIENQFNDLVGEHDSQVSKSYLMFTLN